MNLNRIATLCALLSMGICASSLAYGQAGVNTSQAISPISPAVETVPPSLSRIVSPIDETRLVRLRGNTHPMARPEFDKGPVDPQLPMERMLLLLKRSPEQEAALEALIARQTNPGSPDFHHWLEPAQFGADYGPSDADIAAVSSWLENHGFTVDKVANGRVFIEFSGTAGLVQRAFHTEIHNYTVKGVQHIANNSDPSIPAALSPVVGGIVSLHNFFLEPLHRELGSVRRDRKSGKWTPENESVLNKPLFTLAPTYEGIELVSPYDFATIYNVLPLWNAGIDGTGETIAIAGRSDINLTDVATFRTAFGLPTNLPANTPTIITNGPDPGVPTEGDKTENTLDVEWSGAVAKGAAITFVTTASTATTDGAVVSAMYIIDNNVAPVMSFSYGAYELAIGTTGNAADNSMWQQGAAQGISEFVASGDQGSAACDGGQAAPYQAQYGLAVSGTSSTPYNVAVGGTDLNWANNSGTTYWSATNSANGQSALGYIPEVPWNGTCASVDVDAIIGATSFGWDPETTCEQVLEQDIDTDLVNSVGGTGGASSCIVNGTTSTTTTLDPTSCAGGYAKPSWQTGTGVPADGARDVPDVSLFASSGALDSAYIICDSGESDSTPCTFSNADDALAQAVGGTSVASPAMAGIMAMVVQQSHGVAQGLPNPVLYQLAAQDNLTNCNSTTAAGVNSCFFYDVTTDNNAVPCAPGAPDCTVIHTGDEVGILNGYNATTGYDLASGLGSVNAYNLVFGWSGIITPMVTLSTASVSFGTQEVGSASGIQQVTLTNSGNTTLSFGSVLTGTNASVFYKWSNCSPTLTPGASCTVNLEFIPTAAGPATAALTITDNAGYSPQFITLTGTGTAAQPAVTLSATSVSFGNQALNSSSAATQVTVTNSGTSNLEFYGRLTGTNASEFSKWTNCTGSLAPGAICTIYLNFTPTVAGGALAVMSLFDNAAGSPQAIMLSGTGTAAQPAVTLSQTVIGFGNQALNTTSADMQVTLTNSGGSNLEFYGQLTGTNASEFNKWSNCTGSLAPGAFCTINLYFTPTVGGGATAALAIIDNASGSPQSIMLSGTGTTGLGPTVSRAPLALR